MGLTEITRSREPRRVKTTVSNRPASGSPQRKLPSLAVPSRSSRLRGYCFVARFPTAHKPPVVRMKICPSEIAGELSV